MQCWQEPVRALAQLLYVVAVPPVTALLRGRTGCGLSPGALAPSLTSAAMPARRSRRSASPPARLLARLPLLLLLQFKKGKKRARAQEEAEAMYLAGANSALCIALAKMHMTLAVEQVGGRGGPRRAAFCTPSRGMVVVGGHAVGGCEVGQLGSVGSTQISCLAL